MGNVTESVNQQVQNPQGKRLQTEDDISRTVVAPPSKKQLDDENISGKTSTTTGSSLWNAWSDRVKGFFRGWVPTLLGYNAQGACKFGFYEFFKKYYYDIAGPEYANKYKTLIYLAGSASAEVIAGVALCPFDTVKVPLFSMSSNGIGLQ